MKKLLITLILTAFFLPLDALAQNQNSNTQASQQAQAMGENERIPFMADREASSVAAEPSSAGLIFRTFGAMCLIVGLIFAAAWGLKKYGFVQLNKQPDDAPNLVVVSSVSLGANRTLSVVKFGEKTLLIGSTAQSVTLITDETEARETLTPRSVAEMLADEKALFNDELDKAQSRFKMIDAGRGQI